jgi:hypothetical protein
MATKKSTRPESKPRRGLPPEAERVRSAAILAVIRRLDGIAMRLAVSSAAASGLDDLHMDLRHQEAAGALPEVLDQIYNDVRSAYRDLERQVEWRS